MVVVFWLLQKVFFGMDGEQGILKKSEKKAIWVSRILIDDAGFWLHAFN
jgi:hypothetical protein